MRSKLGLKPGIGVRVASVKPDSLAAQHGMRVNDVIVEINQIPIKSVKQLKQIIAKTAKGDNLLLRLKRKDAALFLAFPLP